jgi:hypothetical protein
MNFRHVAIAVSTMLSLGVSGFTFCRSLGGRRGPTKTLLSQAGRDQAVIQMLQDTRTSVYLRTEGLTLVPVGNELAQALQRKVSVTMELPLNASLKCADSQLSRILMDLGAVVTFKSDAIGNYRGTLLVVDDRQFLYSASPLTLNTPGALVSYVVGPIER